MSDADKVIEYELQIEDMLRAIQERLDELKGQKELNEFEQGRQEAFTEVWEIIQTRHGMILEVLGEE